MRIKVSGFKRIAEAEVNLAKVNVFIGANNAGKSSFIQGIQFAVSTAQTLEIQDVKWIKRYHRVASLDPSDFLYSPTRDITQLHNEGPLKGAKNELAKQIRVQFSIDSNSSMVSISKGKNRGIHSKVEGMDLGKKLCNLSSPFCVYVPGIAGIPIQEKKDVPIVIKKSSTRGDSNNFLRNILHTILANETSSEKFHASIAKIYPGTLVTTNFDENKSEFIESSVHIEGREFPLDLVGTGLLQTIQVFAYLEYFKPQILLLDEPDSHIHPTKQAALALELASRAQEEDGPITVFSTHSRYILEALEGIAKIFHFSEGRVTNDVQNSKILLDIGAADADYLFSKKSLKYIIATEDKVDGIEDKKQYLKSFLIANGLKEGEFVLHSYEGSTKVDFAKTLESFVRKHIPTVRVLIHLDRDQREIEDRDIVSLEAKCLKQEIGLFITEGSEIENYFCRVDHLSEIWALDKPQREALSFAITQFYSELRPITIKKIQDFILNHRSDTIQKEGNKLLDSGKLNKISEELYSKSGEQLTPGKELIGKIKQYLQKLTGKNIDNITKPTQHLKDPKFQSLIANNTTTNFTSKTAL